MKSVHVPCSYVLFLGISLNGSVTGPEMTFEAVKMKFEDDTHGYFKDAFPYYARVCFISDIDTCIDKNRNINIRLTFNTCTFFSSSKVCARYEYEFFFFFIPPANKVWGVYRNHPVCPSVRPCTL
jgi:hypothetical protein